MKRIISGVKSKILSTLRKFGYELHSTEPIDLTGTGRDALDVHTLTRLPRTVVIDVPVDRMRQRFWFALTEEMNPLVATVARYRDHGQITYAGSPLEDYFRFFSPHDAIEAIGLKPSDAPCFVDVDPRGYCLPWKNGKPDKKIELRERVIRKEGLDHGITITKQDGWPDFGPISQSLGQLEINRLTSVYDSIRMEGYRRHAGRDGDLRGQFFLDSEFNWCVNVWWGNHRLAAAAALGYDSLPVRFETMPVREADVVRWPQVLNGNMKREAALKVFHQVMSATPPPACQWVHIARNP